MGSERENLVSRRDAFKPIAAAALASVAAIPAAAAAQSSELASLIEAHRAAHDSFNEICGRDEKIGDAYKEMQARNEIVVPCLLGGGFSLSLGEDECREKIAQQYGRQRNNLKELARIDSKAAAKLLAKLDGVEAKNIAMVDRALEEEAARQEAFGLAAILREYDAGNEAEDVALTAVCAYVPRTPEEGRAKADYLKHMHDRTDGLQPSHVEALLQSIAGGAANV